MAGQVAAASRARRRAGVVEGSHLVVNCTAERRRRKTSSRIIRNIRTGKPGGEFADAGERVGEAVLAGGGEMAREAERSERIGGAGGDFGGRSVAEECAEQREQPFHERRIGVAMETAAPVAQFAHDPGLGDAAAHPVRFGAFPLGKRRQPAGAVHDQRHPFLRVVDQGELVDKSLEFVRERHEKDSVSIFWLKSSRSWPL